jgi:hypothetical protein
MEFLDISLTKGSSLLLHAIHSPFYWLILRKTIWYSSPALKILIKIRETRKLESNHEYHFAEGKNEGRKTRQKFESETTLCPEKPHYKYRSRCFMFLLHSKAKLDDPTVH